MKIASADADIGDFEQDVVRSDRRPFDFANLNGSGFGRKVNHGRRFHDEETS
jgi:hypothetical protein